MKINSQINYVNNHTYNNRQNKAVQFKAQHIGSVRGLMGELGVGIELYRVDKQDINFLNSMVKKIKMYKLAPQYALNKNFLDWQYIIRSAVIDISKGAEGVLAAVNKKPCAIASIEHQLDTNPYVTNLASWPIAPSATVKNAGKSVMRQIYQDVIDSNKQHITLTPLTDGPRDAISFYRSIGFDECFILTGEWRVRRNDIVDYAELMDDSLQYKAVNDSTNYNLNEIMDIEYIPKKSFQFNIGKKFLNFLKGFFKD